MHHAIYISNQEDKQAFLRQLEQGKALTLIDAKPALYSKLLLLHYLRMEYQHDRFDLTGSSDKPLALMSEGEQRKALLAYLLKQRPKTLIVDDVFDSLDIQSQENLAAQLEQLSQNTQIIQLFSRKRDVLRFIENLHQVEQGQLQALQQKSKNGVAHHNRSLPKPTRPQQKLSNPLIELQQVNITYDGRTVVQPFNWQVNKGEFWQLIGPNGSGKSSLLRLITGDSPKGFGQTVKLFGYLKGSGESVWDIKQHIGYFTSSITQNFSRYQTVENMLLSGFYDSVGLYQKPSKQELEAAKQWLSFIGLEDKAKASFDSLSVGHQRLLLVARAMVKHPPLLILDEPTAGLDDSDIEKLITLVNAMAASGNSAIIYVSHREEAGLKAQNLLQLEPSVGGSKVLISRLDQ